MQQALGRIDDDRARGIPGIGVRHLLAPEARINHAFWNGGHRKGLVMQRAVEGGQWRPVGFGRLDGRGLGADTGGQRRNRRRRDEQTSGKHGISCNQRGNEATGAAWRSGRFGRRGCRIGHHCGPGQDQRGRQQLCPAGQAHFRNGRQEGDIHATTLTRQKSRAAAMRRTRLQGRPDLFHNRLRPGQGAPVGNPRPPRQQCHHEKAEQH